MSALQAALKNLVKGMYGCKQNSNITFFYICVEILVKKIFLLKEYLKWYNIVINFQKIILKVKNVFFMWK